MKYRAMHLWWLLVGVLVISLPADAAPNPARIVGRVQAFYDRARVFRARFTQEFWLKSTGQKKRSAGQVIFQKPGKMSWRYTSNANRVVSDGQTVKVYQADSHELYVQKLDQSAYPAALAFLGGGGQLLKSFTFRAAAAAQVNYPGGTVLEGVPRQPTPAYARILLYVDARSSQIQRVMLIDAQGNRNRFDFVDPVVNQPAALAEFEFTAPPGTKVIAP
jgi:outer membrane lipoprotein carrier protein